jgi:hypothetical protein
MTARDQATAEATVADSLMRIGATSLLVAVVGLLGGCSRYGSGEATTHVSSDSTSCMVTKERMSAGPVTFKITNKGHQPVSYEVRGEGDDGEFTDLVMSARDVAAGEEATMSGKLPSGQFQVRCLLASGRVPTVTVRTSVDGTAKPDDIGPEKTFRFTVSREGAVDSPPPMRAREGALVTFALANRSERSVELTVLGPDGRRTSAIRVASRASRETNAVLGSLGTYTVRVGQGPERFSVQVVR